jgi:hypothetical protein
MGKRHRKETNDVEARRRVRLDYQELSATMDEVGRREEFVSPDSDLYETTSNGER